MKESTTGSIPRVTITMQNLVSEPVTTPTLKVRRERTGSVTVRSCGPFGDDAT